MGHMVADTAHAQVLDAAEELFYGRGIHAVGMDDVRTQAGVTLRRLYQLYPSKSELVEGYLDRRDDRWHAQLEAHVERRSDSVERLLAVFDWLGTWFAEPGFRGCAWINGFGELGGDSQAIVRRARAHKRRFRRVIARLVAAAGLPAALTDELMLLAEGAMVTAGIFSTRAPAAHAKRAAAVLIEAARSG
jgi:AcrR family transcriptional regulator